MDIMFVVKLIVTFIDTVFISAFLLLLAGNQKKKGSVTNINGALLFLLNVILIWS